MSVVSQVTRSKLVDESEAMADKREARTSKRELARLSVTDRQQFLPLRFRQPPRYSFYLFGGEVHGVGLSGWGLGCGVGVKDRAPDQFGDMRHYGVSELLVAVYPSGYPMTCSAVSGTGYRWPSTRLHQSCQLFRSGFFTPRLGDCLPPLNAVALGVGHNPHSVPKLSGTSVGSRYAVPFRIIPERGQVSENSANSPSKQCCDVLHDDDPWSKLANQSGELGPQSASCASKTRSTACEANILAGKSSNDCIRLNPVCSQSIGGKRSNIVIKRNSRETRREGGLGFTIELTQSYRLKTARALQPQVKATDPREERKDTQFLHRHTAPVSVGRERVFP